MVKSHSEAIEQLLEDFNDDQMMFGLEAEAYEQERLAAIQTSPPTPTEQNDEPPNEDTTDAKQERPAPVERPPEHTNTPPTMPNPVATEDISLGDITPLAPKTQPPSPTPHLEQTAHTPDPKNILDILEEE